MQFFYKYVLRLPPERKSVPLVFGSAVNEGLLSMDRDLAAARAPHVGGALDAFHEKLAIECNRSDVPVEYDEGESFDTLDAKGRAMIEHYAATLPRDERPLFINDRRFTVPIQDDSGDFLPHPLTGEFDRVVDIDGKIGIVDWKTAARRWSADDLANDAQSTAYVYAYRQVHGCHPAFFRYDLLLKTKTPAIERYHVVRESGHIRRFIRIVKEVDKSLQSGSFIPRDKSWACKSCPFKSRCARWHE